MAITGFHALLYSSEPEALRELLKDAFGFRSIDVAKGWFVFAMPPTDMGVHPGDRPVHEVSFQCDDIAATVAELSAKGVSFKGEPEEQGWGIATTMVLPGGVEVMLYQPKHPTPL
jgi:hypothetical protein